MNMTVFYGRLIPFSGTVLGSACVFFMKNKLNEKLQKALTGKQAIVEKVLMAMLCGGHILLDDVPGVGKTRLVRTLGRVFDLPFSRI